MSEQSNEPPGPPPGPSEPTAPGYGHPGPPPPPYSAGYPSQPGYPTQPGPPAGPTHPMPQWYPAVPRQPFRERTTKLWLALVAGLACLVVGLGVGIAIGHAIGDDDRGPEEFRRFPGGPGFRDHDDRRFGGGDLGRLPDPSQSPQPQTSPGATG